MKHLCLNALLIYSREFIKGLSLVNVIKFVIDSFSKEENESSLLSLVFSKRTERSFASFNFDMSTLYSSACVFVSVRCNVRSRTPIETIRTVSLFISDIVDILILL